MQGGKELDWGYLVLMDRLVGIYDDVKVPEPPEKGQNTRERGKRGGSTRLGDQCLSVLGQRSHYLPNVEGNPPGKYPDLQTQKGIWPEKSVYGGNQQQGG